MGREQISLPKDKMVRRLKIKTSPAIGELVEVVPSEDSGLSGWAVALIVIFVVLVVLTIVVVVYNCNRTKGCGCRGRCRCGRRNHILVSGSANSQPAPFNRSIDNGCNRPSEKKALDNAFQGAMATPPCSGQAYPGSLPTDPIYAGEMNKLATKHADRAFNVALNSLGPSCGSMPQSKLAADLNNTYKTFQPEGYPGITTGEMHQEKLAAALNANGLKAPAPANLTTAGETVPEPGMLAYNVSGPVNRGKGDSPGDEVNEVWRLDPSMDVGLALPEAQRVAHEHTSNPANSMPQTSLLSGEAVTQMRQTNKDLITGAVANPEMSAELLLNAGSIMQPTMATVQRANRMGAEFRPQHATPMLSSLNINLMANLRPNLAMAQTGLTNVPFNMQTLWFEQARASKCQ